jgi:hypothetical protein
MTGSELLPLRKSFLTRVTGNFFLFFFAAYYNFVPCGHGHLSIPSLRAFCDHDGGKLIQFPVAIITAESGSLTCLYCIICFHSRAFIVATTHLRC